ncbi:hypothetical protein ABEB36_005100 [Hypothenemus hampei]|uniref:Uroporphyrinogen-III synthase n=1 Tax=Hypothenemus hampei TaxID=57062 RepID=A0ABD1F0V0_HYPHA
MSIKKFIKKLFLYAMLIPNSVLLLKSQISDDEQDKYESVLKANNFEVIQVKTLEFEFKNIENLRQKLENSSKYSGLVFSSPRCVEAVVKASENIYNFLDQWTIKENFVVGETTYKAALDRLCLNCLGKDSGNALNLSKFILERKRLYPQPFLFPHGNLKSDTLQLNLKHEGIEVEGIEVYNTIANPNLETDFIKITDNFRSIPEFVVFFSPSGFSNSLEYLQKIGEDIKEVKFIAIGPVTALAIVESNLSQSLHGVAERPNPNELLKVILS